MDDSKLKYKNILFMLQSKILRIDKTLEINQGK